MINKLKKLINNFKWHFLFFFVVELILIILFFVRRDDNPYDQQINKVIEFSIRVFPFIMSMFTLNFKSDLNNFEISLPIKIRDIILIRFFISLLFFLITFIALNLMLFRDMKHFGGLSIWITFFILTYSTILYIQIYGESFYKLIIFIITLLFILWISRFLQSSEFRLATKLLNGFIIQPHHYLLFIYLFPLVIIFNSNINLKSLKKKFILIDAGLFILLLILYLLYSGLSKEGKIYNYYIIQDKLYIKIESNSGIYKGFRYNLDKKQFDKKFPSNPWIFFENENGKVLHERYGHGHWRRSGSYEIQTNSGTYNYLYSQSWVKRWGYENFCYRFNRNKNYLVSGGNLFEFDMENFKLTQLKSNLYIDRIYSESIVFIEDRNTYLVNEQIGVQLIPGEYSNRNYSYIVSEGKIYYFDEEDDILHDNKNNKIFEFHNYENLQVFSYAIGKYAIFVDRPYSYILRDGKIEKLEYLPDYESLFSTNISDFYYYTDDKAILKKASGETIAEFSKDGTWDEIEFIYWYKGNYYAIYDVEVREKIKYFPFYQKAHIKNIIRIFKLVNGNWELYDEIL